MPNLYIWFETKTERREFAEKLLSLSLTGYNVSRGELGLYYETLKQSLVQMENGKTKGPYYMLYKKFYLGKIPEARYYNRYSAAEVFRRGFRNMYYQQSYCYRPGNWLVVRTRDTIQGGKIEKWIYENTNKDQIGFNVPICRESVLRGYLRKAKELIRIYEKLDKQEIKYLINSLWYLNKVYDENKELFKNKNVYLWEKLAFYFYNSYFACNKW